MCGRLLEAHLAACINIARRQRLSGGRSDVFARLRGTTWLLPVGQFRTLYDAVINALNFHAQLTSFFCAAASLFEWDTADYHAISWRMAHVKLYPCSPHWRLLCVNSQFLG